MEWRAPGAQVQKAADGALKQLSSQSNSLFPYKLQEVRRAALASPFQLLFSEFYAPENCVPQLPPNMSGLPPEAC